jgi:acetolactate synthase-1/2/3 large subunit
MKVTDYISKYLKDYGVQHVFGFQGGAITPLIDALVNNGIDYIQNYHEQAAGFSADAYARIRNTLGVVVVTNGPGITNLISGIANSHLDSSPCLFISGQIKTFDINTSPGIRQNGFQEIDAVNMVKGITKYAVTVKEAGRIKYELAKAIHIATTGRKGAVLLDLPLDIQQEDINENNLEEYQIISNQKAQDYQIDKIIGLIKNSKKPLIIAGGGIQSSGSYELFRKFSNLTHIPNVATLMGLDAVTQLSYGFSGLYGNTYANLAVYNADLLIILGSRLAKRQIVDTKKYNRGGSIVHIDIDENEIEHNLKTDIKIHADLKSFLFYFNEYIENNNISFDAYMSWDQKLKGWKKKYYDNPCLNKDGLDPVRVIRKISKYIDENSIISSDVGQNQMWIAQSFEVKEGQRLLNSGGLGCMGFSLPAAIGAKIAAPERKMFAFMGDGGFQMNLQELQLISQRRLSVKIVIFNNNTLGMIQEGQIFYYNKRYYGTRIGYHAPNFMGLAETYNIKYICIEKLSETDTLKNIFNDENPYIIEILIQQNPTLLLNRYNEQAIYEQDIF